MYKNGIGEDFNEDSFPPSGWAVTNTDDGNVVWETSSSEPKDSGNYTGGTGNAAAADSNANNKSGDPFDTSLVTPPIPVTLLPGAAILTYKANYQPSGEDALDLDISTDGGTSWTNISHWTTDHGRLLSTPGYDARVGFASYLSAPGSFQLRWRYYGSAWGLYAQIDDVAIGRCMPVPGGLITGQVTNSNTDKGVVGAKVVDDKGESTKTVSNPDDSNFVDGTYLLFASQGNRALTVSASGYATTTGNIMVDNKQIVQKDFVLKAPRFVANPDSFNVHVKVNSSATALFALSNNGDASAMFKILAINNVLPPGSEQMPSVDHRSVPLHIVRGHFSRTDLRGLDKQGRKLDRPRWLGATQPLNEEPPLDDEEANDATWTAVTPYPIPIVDSCAVTDPVTHKVYAFSGVSNSSVTPQDFVYDPMADTWSPIAYFPGGLEKPVCAIINGKVYITDGEGPTFTENDTLYIYDIASDSFTTGADLPYSGSQFAAAGVALNGKFYVIGGCDGASCTQIISRVAVYDPAENSWSAAADYPMDIAWQGCGAADGAIYCGGGVTSSNNDGVKAAYRYDPTTDSWAQIADLLYGNWGMAAIAANGKLLFQDGKTAAGTTNQGQIYDPTTDSWNRLPNSIVTDFRQSAACGFYTIGGSAFVGSTDVSLLAGYDQCGSTKIPWLTVAPTQGTLTAGSSTTVMLTFDSSKQKEFTTSQGYLKITGGPSPLAVPIVVHWEPQPVNLDVSGSVSPTGVARKGDNLAYTITVQNLPDAGGVASRTQLTYEIPKGVNYLATIGARCAPVSAAQGVQAAGLFTGGPIAASVIGPAAVSCDLGTIGPNTGKAMTITVRATPAASSISATFKASAREPDSDPGNNTLTLSTNPNVGPPGPPGTAGSPGPAGPPGPQGAKGDEGSGSFGLLTLATLLGLALMAAGMVERRRQKS